MKKKIKKINNNDKKNWENCVKHKNQIKCNGIEPNPSKDRAMHEGYNPSF
jgi:hypothetical protein